MVKYKQVFQDMLNQNPKLFDEFKAIHDQYLQNPQQYQSEFNNIGYQIQDIIRRYENVLCSHSQNSGFGKYSTNLADKFHQEIKSVFPKIDCIGLD